MRSQQHEETYGGAGRDQKQRHSRQERRDQKGNDDLRPDDDQRGRELHHVVCRCADAMDVAAHQLGDARML